MLYDLHCRAAHSGMDALQGMTIDPGGHFFASGPLQMVKLASSEARGAAGGVGGIIIAYIGGVGARYVNSVHAATTNAAIPVPTKARISRFRGSLNHPQIFIAVPLSSLDRAVGRHIAIAA